MSLDRLTPREKDVLLAVCQGNTDKQAAKVVGLAYYTVKQHMRAAMAKTGINSRVALAVAAAKAGWL